MKFRIKEYKPYGPWREVFYPQVKGFWGWYNIGDVDETFVRSFHNHNDKFDCDKWATIYGRQVFVDTLKEAEDVINAYKRYLSSRSSYETIHEIS